VIAAAPVRPWRERLIRPTLPELWSYLAIALPTLGALIATLPTVDLAYQLRAGDEILAGHGIPSVDTWTFTAAGQPWLDQQWGAQVVLAAVFDLAGWSGLAVVRAVLVAGVFGLILVAIRRRAPDLGARPAAWLTLGAFAVAAPALALRPQLLAMACFAATLALLAGRRAQPRAVWLIPVVAVVWANLHGSFVLAPVLVGLAWLEDLAGGRDRAPRTLVLTIVTATATLVTPFGLEAWRYAAGVATNAEIRTRISEWQPTTPTDVPGVLFWISVALVAAGVAWLARRGRPAAWPAVVLTLVAFAVLGAVTQRGIAWWALVAPVAVAGLLPASTGPQAPPAAPVTRARPERRGSALNAALAGALAIAAIVALPAWRPTDPDTGAPDGLLAYAPSRLTATLLAISAPADRIWNPQVWGSWFEHAVPNPSYALDSRIELIPVAAWSGDDTVRAAAPGWDAVLERYGVTIVVVEGPATAPLPTALDAAGWHREYADADGSIWASGPVAGAAPGLSSRS